LTGGKGEEGTRKFKEFSYYQKEKKRGSWRGCLLQELSKKGGEEKREAFSHTVRSRGKGEGERGGKRDAN